MEGAKRERMPASYYADRRRAEHRHKHRGISRVLRGRRAFPKQQVETYDNDIHGIVNQFNSIVGQFNRIVGEVEEETAEEETAGGTKEEESVASGNDGSDGPTSKAMSNPWA